MTCPRSQSLKAEAPRPYPRSLLAPKAQLSPSCPRLRRCARSGRKHYAPSRIRCTLGLFFLGERHRGVKETLGHAGAYQVTCLRLQVVRNLTCQGTYAGGPGPGRSPAVPYPSRGLVAYRGALTASERSPEAGSGVGWGGEDCSGTCPEHPCPRRLSAGWRRAGVAAAWTPPGPPVRRLGSWESPDPKSNPLRVSDSWPGPWRPRGAVGGLPAHHPSPSPGGPRATLGGIPGAEGGPRARRWASGPLLPSPAPPCHRPAPWFQSGFCGARRPAPRLRTPRGGWLGARRGWRCAPPRLHCCAPCARGSHAPRAPRSPPPGGSAVLWHGPRGRPRLGSGLRR